MLYFARMFRSARGKTLFVLALALALSISVAFGEERKVTVPASPSAIRLIIRGTTTLDPDVVARLTGVERRPEMSAAEIKKRLETSNLFSYVQVLRNANTIYVRVRQKFTVFVLPYVSTDSTGTYYSLAAGKQIVLGEDALVVGYFEVGPSDHKGVAILRDGAILGSPFLTEVSFSYENSLHWIYRDRQIIDSTVNQFHGGHLSFGYRFYPYADIELANYVEQHRFEEINGDYYSGLQWSSMLSLNYDRFYNDVGLSSGWKAKLSYEQTNPLSYFQFWRVSLLPAVSVIRDGSLNWVVHGEASFSPSLPRYQKAELGGSSLRGYDPEEFRDRYYGVVRNDLFLTSTSFWHVNLRSFAFVDWGFINSGGRTGTGGGIQIYPKRVAVSAFQFYVGYGFNPPGISAAFALGQHF